MTTEEEERLRLQIEELDRKLAERPDDAEALFERGNAKCDQEDYAGALSDYDRAIEINPEYAEAFNNRGNVKYDLKDYEGAIADYDRAIEIDPEYTEAYCNRGDTKNELNDYMGAIADYDRAVELDPDDAEAYYNRGVTKDNLKDYKGAIADYDRAIEINPIYAEAYCNRGDTKDELNDYKGAIADYDRAIEINPDDAKAYYNRGVTKDNLKDYKGAIADYDRAIEINPDDAVAFNNRGNTKGELKDYKGAIADYDRAIEIDPEDAMLYNNRGLTKVELKDYKGALSDFDRAIEIAPEDADLYNNRGSAKAELQDYTGAIADYDRAIEIMPDLIEAHINRLHIETSLNPFKKDALSKELFSLFKIYEQRQNAEKRTKQTKQTLPYNPEQVFKLKQLKLIDIGHFDEEVTFDFHENLTCIVGRNGSGKSTVLKALTLALIGTEVEDYDSLNQRKIKNLLRRWYQNDKAEFAAQGSIELTYTVKDPTLEGEPAEFTNKVTLTRKPGIETSYNESGDYHTRLGNGKMAHLFIGFPQHHDEYDPNYEPEEERLANPNVRDLFPLLNERDDKRLNHFVGWLVNLHNELEQSGKKDRFEAIVAEAFDMLNQVLLEKDYKNKGRAPQVEFIKIHKAFPPELRLRTAKHPEGILVELLSVGFKYTMGWLGYIFSRLYEAYPKLNDEGVPVCDRHAVVLFDEVDASIHPYWQSGLLRDLTQTFPNVQFIVTTHSPLAIGGLDKEQVLMIEQAPKTTQSNATDRQIVVRPSPVDLWVLKVRDILRINFGTHDLEPTESYEELRQALYEIKDPEERKAIQRKIKRLVDSLNFDEF